MAQPLIERKCLLCGKTFWAKPYAVRTGWAKYCSRACSDKPGKKGPPLTASEKRKRYENKYPERIAANKILRDAVRKGKVKPKPCAECGNPKSHGHHPDYSKPLKVIWLCVRHHARLHGMLRCKARIAEYRKQNRKEAAHRKSRRTR